MSDRSKRTGFLKDNVSLDSFENEDDEVIEHIPPLKEDLSKQGWISTSRGLLKRVLSAPRSIQVQRHFDSSDSENENKSESENKDIIENDSSLELKEVQVPIKYRNIKTQSRNKNKHEEEKAVIIDLITPPSPISVVTSPPSSPLANLTQIIEENTNIDATKTKTVITNPPFNFDFGSINASFSPLSSSSSSSSSPPKTPQNVPSPSTHLQQDNTTLINNENNTTLLNEDNLNDNSSDLEHAQKQTPPFNFYFSPPTPPTELNTPQFTETNTPPPLTKIDSPIFQPTEPITPLPITETNTSPLQPTEPITPTLRLTQTNEPTSQHNNTDTLTYQQTEPITPTLQLSTIDSPPIETHTPPQITKTDLSTFQPIKTSNIQTHQAIETNILASQPSQVTDRPLQTATTPPTTISHKKHISELLEEQELEIVEMKKRIKKREGEMQKRYEEEKEKMNKRYREEEDEMNKRYREEEDEMSKKSREEEETLRKKHNTQIINYYSLPETPL